MTQGHQEQRTYRALRGNADEGLLTGEGVLLEIPAASLPHRLGSGLLDLLVAAIGLIVSMIVLANVTGGLSDIVIASLTLLVTVAWTVGVPTALETFTRGRTLGKLITGLRTVRQDGGPISFRHALTRHLVGFLEIYALFGGPAAVSGFVTERSRRLGDLTAGTDVVRIRSRLPALGAPPMPQELARWATSADLGPLPDGLALQIRRLLLGAAQMTPAARDATGRDLLQQALARVSPPPPPGHPTSVVLAAILAERRRRDALRLDRDELTRRRVLPPDPVQAPTP